MKQPDLDAAGTAAADALRTYAETLRRRADQLDQIDSDAAEQLRRRAESAAITAQEIRRTL